MACAHEEVALSWSSVASPDALALWSPLGWFITGLDFGGSGRLFAFAYVPRFWSRLVLACLTSAFRSCPLSWLGVGADNFPDSFSLDNVQIAAQGVDRAAGAVSSASASGSVVRTGGAALANVHAFLAFPDSAAAS